MRKKLLVLAAFAVLTSWKKNDTENIEEPQKLSPDIEVLVKGATQETSLDHFINDPIKKAAVHAYLEQHFAAKAVKLTN